MASALSGAFSGLLAFAIAKMDGTGGKPGWAWIFILEGAVTVLLGTFTSVKLVLANENRCPLLLLHAGSPFAIWSLVRAARDSLP
jgi:uncharacterized membrane protein